MSKIFITGIVASGKTTLAKELSRRTGTPWHELDAIVYDHTGEARYKRTPEEQQHVIADIDAAGGWIIEDTCRKSCRCLLDMAQRIVFLDTPLWKRRIRIFTRFIKQRLGIERCLYHADLHMLRMMYKWTADFERDRASFTAMLGEYGEKVVVVRKAEEALDLL